jgi:hypothetical protein
MKLIIKVGAIIAIFISAEIFPLADDLPIAPPKSSWEEQSGGLALAFAFVTHKEGESEKSSLSIYIKNTSDNAKEFDQDSILRGFEVLDTNVGSSWHPLRTVDPFALTRVATAMIQPGQTISCPIELSADESKLIRSHLVRLRVAMSDNVNKQVLNIESTPRQLTETVITAPTK